MPKACNILRQAIGEEGKDCLSFLAACRAALQASPQRPLDPGDLLSSAPEKCTLVFSTKCSPLSIFHLTGICTTGSSSYCPCSTWAFGPIQTVTPIPQPYCISTPIRSHLKSGLWGATPKRRDEMPLHRASTVSQKEAFTRDSDLVWKAREEHYKTNCPHFDCKTSHNLTNVFWGIIMSTSLLGFQIYKIYEVWEGWSKLQYTNDVLRALPIGCNSSTLYLPQNHPKSSA